MAIIGKIRKQSTILLIAVGGAMVLFVLGDLLGGGTSVFTGPDDKVGEINGKKVTYSEFEQRVQKALEDRYGGSASNDQVRELRDQIWEEMVREYTLDEQMKGLGLSVSDKEVFYVIQNDPQNPILRSYFSDPQTGQLYEQFRNPNGTVNTSAVMNYFRQVLNADPDENPEAADARRSIQFLTRNMKQTMLDSKYGYMVSSGIYATNYEIQKESEYSGKQITVSYALKSYDELPDEEFMPSDKELKSYYNKVKDEARFEQKEALRSIEYVLFDVIPTPEDTQQVVEELKAMIPSFRNTEDDTLFVNENADTPFNIKWASRYDLPSGKDTLILNASLDSIIGPYRNKDRFELTKVIGHKTAPDSAKARHILIGFNEQERDTTAARAVIDSLRAVIKEEDNFDEIARQYSMDSGTRDKGGELDWFKEGQMVPAFNDFCFSGKPGDTKVITSQYGVHLIEILEHTPEVKKALIAVIDNKIEPSQKTYQNAYSEANSFALENKDPEDFLEEGEKYGSQSAPAVRTDDKTIDGIANTRSVIRWAFEEDAGEVSQVFDLQGKYLVALITEVREKGKLPFDIVKDDLVDELMNKKKAEHIISGSSEISDLNTAAQEWGVQVKKSQPFSFSDFTITGLGSEPEIQGAAFAMSEGETVGPIEGRKGVFVIRADEIETRPGNASRESIESLIAGNAATKAEQAIKDRAEIIDRRVKFY